MQANGIRLPARRLERGTSLGQLSLILAAGLLTLVSVTAGGFLIVRSLRIRRLRKELAVGDEGIAFCAQVPIGDLRQWIQIRGRDRSNPILLYLHGGPGGALISVGYARQGEWEKHFTVVHWDQRGAGKTLFSNLFRTRKSDVTFERLLQDTGEVIDFVCEKLGQDKLFLLGHSWGSELGIPVTRRFASRLHGYIGLGQVVSVLDNERVGYAWVLEEARQRGNEKAVKELEGIAPYPSETKFEKRKLFVQRKWVARFGGSHPGAERVETNRLMNLLFSPYMSLSDIFLYFWFYHGPGGIPYIPLMNEKLHMDFRKTHRRFEIPIVLIEGRHDWQTPSVLAREWFETIEAPVKIWEWMENSGHYITAEEPERFVELLVGKVKPLALEDTAHVAGAPSAAGDGAGTGRKREQP